MKKYIIILVLGVFAACGCAKDPWSNVENADFRDRMILDIKLAGQVGVSEIENTDASTGTVTLQLASFLVEDMSNVEIETLVTSYKATSSMVAGDILDFTADEAPVITVTAPTGEKRAYTILMQEFNEDILGSYKITTSYVWGGTGVSYGGGAVTEPSKKSWCWNEEGYGPAAEYDDYLEFTFEEVMADGNTTGKCIHYGGEDGKHWNCIFTGKDKAGNDVTVDLHDYYRKIPVGESTWVRNYTDNTLTFIDKDGKETVGSLVDAGTYQLGQYNTIVYSVTVDDKAFRFDINGPEDWDNTYTDYDKLARRAVTFFVLADKLDEGETIPEASKTEGTEGDITIPEPEPEPEPDGEFAGEYVMQEFHVYGGKEPALIKPVDKSWVFNNVADESDNTLSIATEDNVSGTLDYGAGADGKFWDYIFKGDYVKPEAGEDVDCSANYGWLPHGESSFSISEADGEMTVTVTQGDRSVSAKILEPGESYTYGTKTVTIPADGIGFSYETENTGSSVDMYGDYGRLVLCPVEYIMVFKKTAEE